MKVATYGWPNDKLQILKDSHVIISIDLNKDVERDSVLEEACLDIKCKYV